jgi:hypothetical protein
MTCPENSGNLGEQQHLFAIFSRLVLSCFLVLELEMVAG